MCIRMFDNCSIDNFAKKLPRIQVKIKIICFDMNQANSKKSIVQDDSGF